MKKYILILGVAGVALGSYAAMASNSATMTVTAAIVHDVSLSVGTNLNIGTITVNPGYGNGEETSGCVEYDSNGAVTSISGAFTNATAATPGTFTANIPNPSACDTASDDCGGLVLNDNDVYFGGILSGTDSNFDYCEFRILHTGGNSFKVYPDNCYFDGKPASYLTSGTHTKNLTISYTAG
ncbi:MAG: hypothetical protein IJ689_03490 [Alphaproteobacteria bacterium]|nr:hypothetical protein [Alphaproteobacteria bacterium]